MMTDPTGEMEESLDQHPHSTPKGQVGGRKSGRSGARDEGSISPSLDDTGESTRSLLSVLSHSSIRDIDEELLAGKSQSESRSSRSRSRSRSRSPSSGSSSHRSSASSSRTTSHSRSDTATASSRPSHPWSADSRSTTTKTSTSGKAPSLSAWEKWLVEKTKEERKKTRLKLKEEKEKCTKAEEEKKLNVAKKEVIEAKVKVWIEEKTVKHLESTKANKRLERTKKQMESDKKKSDAEKAQTNYTQWMESKKKEKEDREKKQREEERAREEEKRRRKAEAEVAFASWKKDAVNKPQPVPSSCYNDKASYPVPGFYNPVPWMPIHTPKEPSSEVGQKSKTKKKQNKARKGSSASLRQIQQPLSPPLLFRERAAKAGRKTCDRPR